MSIENEGTVASTPEEATSAIQKGYDAIANPEKVLDVEPVIVHEDVQTEEIPPEPSINDQVKGLQAQMARLSELEKQIEKRSRDDGGRYGALKQTLEQLQQRMSTSPNDAATNAADVDELLKDLTEEYPELSSSLKGAFSKVLASKGGVIDPDSIGNIVAERIKAERKAEFDTALKAVIDKHEDFYTMRETPSFKAWRETLSPRERSMFSRSEDPVYVSEMLDEYKDWNTKEVAKTSAAKQGANHQKSRSRLEAAVLPTSGAKSSTGELSPKDAMRAGYEKVAGARLR